MKQLNILCKTYQSIHQVPEKDWETIAQDASIVYSFSYWKLLEESDIKGFYDLTYILIYEGDRPAFISVCYLLNKDLLEYGLGPLRFFVNKIRKIYPEFLNLKVLEFGAPINIHTPPFLTRPDSDISAIFQAFTEEIKAIAGQKKPFLIEVKDIFPNQHVDQKLFDFLVNNDFSIARGQPNALIELTWKSADDYIASMKSYYRSKLLKHLRRNEDRALSWQLTKDFYQMSQDLARQWMLVHNKANHIHREVLNSKFYQSIDVAFPEESMVLLLYDGDQLIGHALLLMDGDTLRWLYIGRNNTENDSLYMLMMYKIIDVGISLNAKKIDCGPTTYSIKRDMGAKIEDLSYAFKLKSALLNRLFSGIVSRFNTVQAIKNKQIFKKELG